MDWAAVPDREAETVDRWEGWEAFPVEAVLQAGGEEEKEGEEEATDPVWEAGWEAEADRRAWAATEAGGRAGLA